MSETTGEIQAQIRESREELGAHLDELGQKVKSAADWRHRFEKSPGLFLAGALGTGVLLAYATRRRSARPSLPQPVVEPQGSTRPVRRPRGPLSESLGEIGGALIGLGATHVKNALSEVLPGFEAQLAEKDKAEAARRAAN